MSQGDWIDVPDDYGSSTIPTMEIKNSNRGSFADMYAPAVMQVESNMDPYAVNKRSGAKGLGQFMDATGLELSQKLGYSEYKPFDADQNKALTHAYLNQLYDQFQSPELALAAYNFGMGNVQKKIDQAGSRDINAIMPLLPEETRNYIPRVQGNLSQGAQVQGQSDYAAPNPQPSPSPSPASNDGWVDVPDEQWVDAPTETTPTEMGWGEYSRGLGGQAVQGLTFNFGDELGLVNPDLANRMQEQYPKASIAANIGGGLALPLGAAKGLSKAPSLARLLLGAGPKAAASTSLGRVAQGAGYGAAYGGLSGAGAAEGGATERAVGAGLGATGGAVLGGGTGALIEAGGEGLKRLLLNGSERRLSNKMVDVLPEDKTAALAKMLKAQEEGTPLFLPEALDQNRFYEQARKVANDENNTAIVGKILKDRTDEQSSRLTNALDQMSPQRDSYEAGSALQDRAQKVIQGEEKAKKETAMQLFGEAYKKPPIREVVDSPAFDEVLNSPIAQSTMKYLRKFPEYANLADDDPKMVQKLLEEFTAQQQSANVGSRASDYGKMKEVIYDALETANPELINARNTFRIDSEKIKALKDVGLGNLANKDQFNVTTFGKMLLDPNTPIQKLEKISEALGDGGDEMIAASVRSHIQNLVDKKKDNLDAASIFANKAMRDRVRAVIGNDEKADKLLSQIADEVLIGKRTSGYNRGSSTVDNDKNLIDLFKENAGFLASTIRHPAIGLSDLAGALMGTPKGVIQDEAQMIFNNKKGIEALQKILGAESKLGNYNRAGSKVANAAIRGGTTIPTIEIKNNYRGN